MLAPLAALFAPAEPAAAGSETSNSVSLIPLEFSSTLQAAQQRTNVMHRVCASACVGAPAQFCTEVCETSHSLEAESPRFDVPSRAIAMRA